jgi:hypothetical protein
MSLHANKNQGIAMKLQEGKIENGRSEVAIYKRRWEET